MKYFLRRKDTIQELTVQQTEIRKFRIGECEGMPVLQTRADGTSSLKTKKEQNKFQCRGKSANILVTDEQERTTTVNHVSKHVRNNDLISVDLRCRADTISDPPWRSGAS